jgi:hypothetical protein
MISQSLCTFVARMLRNKRITFRDVQSLQREILTHGLSNREEAEALIALDQAVTRADPAWAGYLVGIVVEFAVWGSRPTGYIDAETARWLAAWLSCEKPSKAVLRIGREVISEAQDVDEALRSFVKRGSGRSGKLQAATATHLGA